MKEWLPSIRFISSMRTPRRGYPYRPSRYK